MTITSGWTAAPVAAATALFALAAGGCASDQAQQRPASTWDQAQEQAAQAQEAQEAQAQEAQAQEAQSELPVPPYSAPDAADSERDARRSQAEAGDRDETPRTGDTEAREQGEGAREPDNTAINERDQAGALTPLDQSNADRDLDLTQRIRQAVIDDDSLSFTAKNIRIITVDGEVTLRGPVNNQKERQAIEGIARRIAGAAQVESQLEVKE